MGNNVNQIQIYVSLIKCCKRGKGLAEEKEVANVDTGILDEEKQLKKH